MAEKIVFPGRFSRLENLARGGRRAAGAAAGAVGMLFVAGIFEGGFRQLIDSTPARYAFALATAALWAWYFMARTGKAENAPRRNRRVLTTPEGVPLELDIAGAGERLVAFSIDVGIIFAGSFLLALLMERIVVLGEGTAAARTLLLFASFLARTFYFIVFELLWQGVTPGKRTCGLRVINRNGGELTSGAVTARNLIREAEIFLPLSLLFSLDVDAGAARQFAFVGWAALGCALPLLNRDRLRPGDIIAGTQVIAMPKRELSLDLSLRTPDAGRKSYAFTHEQLSKYGAYELQVLEELLRRPRNRETRMLLDEVCATIRRKIEWPEPVPAGRTIEFLNDFYTAERAELERGKLFGRLREDKNAPG